MRCHVFGFGVRRLLGIAVLALVLSGCGSEEIVKPTELTESAAIQAETIGREPATDPAPTVADFSEEPGEAEGFIHSYPLDSSVRYDLNGDGTGEDITVYARECSEGKVCVGDLELEFSSIYPTGYFTVWNIDWGDTLLIGVSDYGFSDDPMTLLFAYDGEKITEVGYFEDIAGTNAWEHTGAVCHGDGTISARTRFDVLGTWTAMAKYALKDGTLVDITEVYAYIPWDEQSQGWEVTTKVPVVTYEDIWNWETQVIVPADTKLAMTGMRKGSVEGTYWVCFQVASMEKTLWMAAEVVDWYTNAAAESGFLLSEEVFDGFFYAG